jgi:hypothetical protein
MAGATDLRMAMSLLTGEIDTGKVATFLVALLAAPAAAGWHAYSLGRQRKRPLPTALSDIVGQYVVGADDATWDYARECGLWPRAAARTSEKSSPTGGS